MKKISLSLFILFLLILSVNAQVPPYGFNYSAIARDASGQAIASTNIGIRLSILKSSPTGNAIYIENHIASTDNFGLFNIIIGGGSIVTGNMNVIEWSDDIYYLKVDMDVNGGSNYVFMGSTQFLSVPYALHAKTAGNLAGSGNNFMHFIGEQFGGGVIFHLWKDDQGQEHGLIVDLVNLNTSHVWSNIDQTAVGPAAQSTFDGFANSTAIIGQPGHTTSAALLCMNSPNQSQTDWYLPAIDELSILWHQRFNVNKTLATIPGAALLSSANQFWSSTEGDDPELVFAFDFLNGVPAYGTSKNNTLYVRAIRSF